MMKISEPSSAKITLRGLVKSYHYQPVLDNLNLVVEDGDFCLLVGANGAGKTTLLRIIASLVRPDSGEIHLGDAPLGISPLLRQKIGFISHQPMFYQDLTAVENLRHYARLYQIPHIEKAIKNMIQFVGLSRHFNKPLRAYSRGMQQRLSIARALLHDPVILLFDEPYTGLDQDAAHFLDGKLKQLHQPGHAILLAAHRPQRLLPIASHIAWLKDGKISLHFPMSRLPESPELERYLQEVA